MPCRFRSGVLESHGTMLVGGTGAETTAWSCAAQTPNDPA